MKKQFVLTDYGVIPDKAEKQTKEIQRVLDLCRDEGGTVIVPRGRYLVSGLRLWSDTTLLLKSGAVLKGSDVCEDYEVFDVPEGVELHTDMQMIPRYYDKFPGPEYRRAILSMYGGHDIEILGEEGSLIDGDDCTDPKGEEGFRGPHGIFLTNVTNVTLRGYSIVNCGNFMHQVDTCRSVTMKNVTCEGGSDGIHLHCSRDVLIEDCVFHTGDDCVAGINVRNLTVRRCEMNTSCDVFRMGGTHILVDSCHIWGPGIFPHRMSVVQNRGTEKVRLKSNTLPREAGRHNLISVYLHFGSEEHPFGEPYRDVVFRSCLVENADSFLGYHADGGATENGSYLAEFALEDVTCTNLKESSYVSASAEFPLTVRLKNATSTGAPIFKEPMANTTVITE